VPALQPATLDALARLGVTSVSLVRDEETAALVLEGWAFDPAHSAAAAAKAVGAVPPTRTLRPALHVAVAGAAAREG
jgi:hypothetical protein